MLIKRLWLDLAPDDSPLDPHNGDVNVFVEMENAELWMAHFVTIPYLRQQMAMSADVARTESHLGRVGYVALETPHVIVDHLSREVIEDVVDNLLFLGTFEAVFDLVMDTHEEERPRFNDSPL